MLLAARAMLVVPALTECLHDERRGMRKFAAAALGKIGAHMSPAVAGLAEASDVCKGVAGASVPELSESLKDPCADVRKAAVVALQQFGMRAVPAVSALREGLQDTSPGVRQEAARCLGQLGGNASSALPALTEQLKDDAAGWVTPVGNQGTVFMEEMNEGVTMKVVKETILTSSFSLSGDGAKEEKKKKDVTRKLKEGELVEVRQWMMKEETSGLMRTKVKTRVARRGIKRANCQRRCLRSLRPRQPPRRRPKHPRTKIASLTRQLCLRGSIRASSPTSAPTP